MGLEGKRGFCVEITISNKVDADLVALKYADDFFGAHKTVAKLIGFNEHVSNGSATFCDGTGIAAGQVVFVGVGPLREFRYEGIQNFGRRIVKLCRQNHRPIRHVALTIHGPGYGLDPEEFFLSMVAGLVEERSRGEHRLRKITIAELSEKRCEIFESVLKSRLHEFGLRPGVLGANANLLSDTIDEPVLRDNIITFGVKAEEKPRLFVAMPFEDEFMDEFEIGFHEAAKADSFICERLDLESFKDPARKRK